MWIYVTLVVLAGLAFLTRTVQMLRSAPGRADRENADQL
jgi:hypothetical protein